MIKIEDCIYTSCYCEENVYKLIESYPGNKDDISAIFISNPRKQCVIWCQKKSEEPMVEPVVWDYHVVAVAKDVNSDSRFIYDLDTVLPFPCPFETYISQCFRPKHPHIDSFYLDFASRSGHYFRPISGSQYLETFSSDRSHMIDKSSGKWLSPPPSYDPIFKSDLGHNLQDFLSFSNNSVAGQWMAGDELVDSFK